MNIWNGGMSTWNTSALIDPRGERTRSFIYLLLLFFFYNGHVLNYITSDSAERERL
jgi:hypothetical protein